MRVLFVLATVVGSAFMVACSGGSGDDATATATAPLVTATATSVDGSPTVASPSPTVTTTKPAGTATATPTASATSTPSPTSPAGPTKTPVPPTATTAPSPTPAFPLHATIQMVGNVKYRFSPSQVEIGQGGSVTWEWVAGIHNVMGDTAGSPISEPTPTGDPGHTYTATFPAKGTFAFHCDVHPADMKGTVTVR